MILLRDKEDIHSKKETFGGHSISLGNKIDKKYQLIKNINGTYTNTVIYKTSTFN